MKADIIIESKAVFTGLKDSYEHLAIAIKKNKILAVHTVDLIKQHFCGDGTTLIDAESKLVMPGFHDAWIS